MHMCSFKIQILLYINWKTIKLKIKIFEIREKIRNDLDCDLLI